MFQSMIESISHTKLSILVLQMIIDYQLYPILCVSLFAVITWLVLKHLLISFVSNSIYLSLEDKIQFFCNDSTPETKTLQVNSNAHISKGSSATQQPPGSRAAIEISRKLTVNNSGAPSRVIHYDVFINHRGPDVKNTLATNLYRRLLDHRLRVFLDKPELVEGRNITTQIEAAIQVASVHIAIFSPNYAQSKWCLDELHLMVKSKATILPVFYKVKPSELRWTGKGKRGSYAEALFDHEQKKTYDSETGEEKPRYDIRTIQNWRDALSHVADISGFEMDG